MSQEKTLQNCRLCKSRRIKNLLKKDSALIFKCRDCGIVFLGNELNEKSIEDLYKYYSSTGFSNYLSPVTKLRYEKLLDGFEKYRKNNRLIDIGCGAGYFMLAASKKGWQVEGIEISDEAIKLSEEKGQKVFKGDVDSLDLEKNKYDVAILTELLEHARNPEAIIKRLCYILRPGGIAYLTTPNYEGLTRRLAGSRWGMFNMEHMFYFTPKILTSILKRHGFNIKKIKTENLLLIEISKLFRKTKPFDFKKGYEKQEKVRELTERNIFFSVAKKLANLILNILRLGDTIYIVAEK